ncbi:MULTISPECIES: helix-turn-helix domain-containing protein [Nitrosomonas]|jgi:Fis family transcriptional regulator|uniref:Putative Fis-like DNA-binding protein n=1 Tax=Nitrosomonas oligotropha TaxID=42354 RepID=A0A1H8MGX1_9PROT|nr:helix-turn-helix domain-containing protein [Nitrosomonas oligotropha]MBK7491265.1 Fis family transcriptional regulator [Nitrosomonas sp.]OQW83253.1 MAG: Fis family transcriptional regulator [Proteobacteria bacterium ST_bin16]MBP9101174.1 Fis family transcriptional regulator [Nitrosomonas sp.]MBX9917236.1 Fis family transcriptional regulator [Nitrosomonas sp.]PTQ78317.1 DNA-binding protein Fis [Nitrosomonas oligotropha]
MNAIKENEIASCIRKAISGYLNDLDGEKPCPIYNMVMHSVEKPLIEIAIQYTKGNQTQAAELLGINRNTLRQKMKQYQIK